MIEAVHEISEVGLTVRAKPYGQGDLATGGLVVPRTCHVQLAAGDGGKLVVELLQDGLVSAFPIRQVIWS